MISKPNSKDCVEQAILSLACSLEKHAEAIASDCDDCMDILIQAELKPDEIVAFEVTKTYVCREPLKMRIKKDV
jgi:hypothetical protein